MKKSKTIKLFLVMMLLLVIGLFGCGNKESGSKEEGATTNWPHKKTTLILPFDAGGSLDTMMRVLAKGLEKELDTKITIDNRPGAATQVGTTLFQKSKDDGSVIFGGTQLYLSASILLQDADYTIDDFSMVNIEQFDPITITVPKDSPYETLLDLIKDAKDNPGKISYSTVHGGPLHLSGVLLEDKLDVVFNPVFYDGGGEMRNALLGGHVDFMIGNALGDNAIADNVRVLAVGTEEATELWPGSKSINEVLKDYDVEMPKVGSVRFLATQASFKEKNPELFEMLVQAYKKVYESEEYQAYIDETNAQVVSEYRGPEESDGLNLSLHELLSEYTDVLKNE